MSSDLAPPHQRGARVPFIGTGVALVGVLFVVSLLIGASAVSPADVWNDTGQARTIFLQSRLPRTIAVVLAGASVSVAGIIMQSLTQNRFVAPSTAGTMEASVLGVVIASILVPGSSVVTKMLFATGAAMLGTMLFVSLIQRLRTRDIIIVPLVGIMLGVVLESISVFLAHRHSLLQSLSSWMTGDFSATVQGRYELLYVVGGAAGIAYLFANRFTLAGVGREYSVNVGLDYDRTMVIGMSLVAIVSGIVVVVVGEVRFLGLVVPNLITARFGDNLRSVLPLTAVAGAGILLTADIAARTIRYPYEIPAGVVVGVAGGLAFLVMLLRSRS